MLVILLMMMMMIMMIVMLIMIPQAFDSAREETKISFIRKFSLIHSGEH